MSKYEIKTISFDDVFKALKKMESNVLTEDDAKQFHYHIRDNEYSLFKYSGMDRGVFFRSYNYAEAVDSLYDKDNNASTQYDLRVKLSKTNPNNGRPYYETNTSLYLNPIFTVGINDSELINHDIVPENGLFIAFFNGERKPLSELSQIFFTGWIQTGINYDGDDPVREGKLELGKQLTVEMLDDETPIISNTARPPLFCFEKMNHLRHLRDKGPINQVDLLTAPLFYYAMIRDKLRFIMSVHKAGQIDKNLFIQMKNSFLKYYEVLGSNPQYNKKVLNRVVFFPANVERINPDYYDETSDPTDLTYLIGDGSSQSKSIYAHNVKNRNDYLKSGNGYDKTKSIIREDFDGRYEWNFWNRSTLRTTLDQIISERIDFHKMDFDRMTKNYGFQLIANSDASRMKGTHVVVNPEIVREMIKNDPSRIKYMDNHPDTYADVLLGKLFPESNQFLSLYPSKVEDNESETIANTKKNQVRQHSLTSGNFLKVGERNLKKQFKIEKLEDGNWVEQPDGMFDRSKIYLHHDAEFIGKQSNCQLNMLTAFISAPKTYVDLTYDQFVNMNDDEFQEYQLNLEGVDCKARISEEIAKLSIIRNKKVNLDVYPSNYSYVLKHIISELDNNGIYTMDFNEGVKIDDNIITPNKLKLVNELRCTSEGCGALILPAYAEAKDDFGEEYEYHMDDKQDISNYEGDMLCPSCGTAYDYDKATIANEMFSPVEFKQYTINKLIFCGYEPTEEGLVLHVDLHIQRGQSRQIDQLTKALPVPTGKEFLGTIQQEIKHPETGEVYRVTADLDMNHYPGANKAKMNGIAVSSLRMINAVFGTKYCPDSEIKELAEKEARSEFGMTMVAAQGSKDVLYTNAIKEIQERYNTMLTECIKPAKITRAVIDPKTKQKVIIEEEVACGLVFSAASEVDDEFSKVKVTENASLLTFKRIDFQYNLGLQDITHAIRRSRTKGQSDEEFAHLEESLKIIHSDFEEGVHIPKSQLLTNIVILQPNGKFGNLFHTNNEDRIDVNNMMKWEDYQVLLQNHRLLNKEKSVLSYEKVVMDKETGEIENVKESVDFSKGVTVAVPVRERINDAMQITIKPLRLPSTQFIINKTVPLKNHVRLANECKEALKIYYTIGSIGNNLKNKTQILLNRYKNSGKMISPMAALEEAKRDVQDSNCSLSIKQYRRYKRIFKDPIEKKKADIHEITAFRLPCLSGKVIGSKEIPACTIVVSNKMYGKMARNYLKTVYENGEITEEQYDAVLMHNKNVLRYPLYGLSNRDPNIMESQEVASFIQIWSEERADMYFRETYGFPFRDKYPVFSGIMKNQINLVMFEQADSDGDFDREFVPCSVEAQQAIETQFKKMKNFNQLRQADEDSPMYELKQVQLPWAFKYLQKEYEDGTKNYLEVDEGKITLDVQYNIIDSNHVNTSLHQNTQAKGNIAYLSSSMWTLDIYTEYLVSIGKLTPRERKYLQYFYQMVFVQDGCIRALKGSGELGFCTLDNIAIDKKILLVDVHGKESEVHVRDLVRNYAKKFTEEYEIDIFEKILEPLFFGVVADSWAKIAGFTYSPDGRSTKLGNMQVKKNETMEPIASLVHTIKKFTYATSGSFQNKDEFGLYENLTIKNQNGEEILPKMKSFQMLEGIYDIVKKIKRKGE